MLKPHLNESLNHPFAKLLLSFFFLFYFLVFSFTFAQSNSIQFGASNASYLLPDLPQGSNESFIGCLYDLGHSNNGQLILIDTSTSTSEK